MADKGQTVSKGTPAGTGGAPGPAGPGPTGGAGATPPAGGAGAAGGAPAAVPGAPAAGVAAAPAPRRGPGHRAADVRDTMAELAAKAQEISQEAGSKMASTMRDVIHAAAGMASFTVESARDLVQYMVRRGQITPEQGERLLREAEEGSKKSGASTRPSTRPPEVRPEPRATAAPPSISMPSGSGVSPARPAAKAAPSVPAPTPAPATPPPPKSAPARPRPEAAKLAARKGSGPAKASGVSKAAAKGRTAAKSAGTAKKRPAKKSAPAKAAKRPAAKRPAAKRK